MTSVLQFLSTPSARRATLATPGHDGLQFDFYPRPPRGGRPRWFSEGDGCESISIHALREEGDLLSSLLSAHFGDFYPRPPRGGRLFTFRFTSYAGWISIHALREEGDVRRRKDVHKRRNFYPRPPRGGRPVAPG